MSVVNIRKLKEVLNLPSLVYGVLKDGVGDKAKPLEVTPEGNLGVEIYNRNDGVSPIVTRGIAGLLSSGIKTADAQIKGSAGAVYWLTVSDDTDALSIELNDSTDDSGSDIWGFDLPAEGYAHFIFDPPLEFSNGIWLDVDDADNTCKVTVGYK